jgi:hypothetical protein
MKQKAILTSLTTLALMAGSAAASASSATFNAFPTDKSTVVVEANADFVNNLGIASPIADTPYNGVVNYTKGLWATGGVSSAYLTFSLGDAASSNSPAFIRPVREWAQVRSVNDGASSLTTLPASIEVNPQSFVVGTIFSRTIPVVVGGVTIPYVLNYTTTADDVALASALGVKNPAETSVAGSVGNYFNLDVTSLLNASNSGKLNFSLGVDSKYPDIAYGSNAYTIASLLVGGTNLPAGQPIFMTETYLFKNATLNVNYTPAPAAVPVPAAVWLFGSALAGLIGFRRKSV